MTKKTPLLIASVSLAATCVSHAVTLVQTDSTSIAFDATSYTFADPLWTEIADTTTGTSLSGTVMVYNDSLGIDAGNGTQAPAGAKATDNSTPGPADLLTYTIDFTAPGDYYLYMLLDVGTNGFANNNDSVWTPADFDIENAPVLAANNLSSGTSNDYGWSRVSSLIGGVGAGVTDDNGAVSILKYTIDGTQATAGNTISFSIAGREPDIQIDRLVFSTSSSLTATELSANTVAVPEPSAFALIAGSLALSAMMVRRRR